MNESGRKAFKVFHQHAAKDEIGSQPSVVTGGPLGGTISGEEALDLPWRELLSSGLVQGGYARMVTSLETLVVGRQVKALRVGMDMFEQDIWYYVSSWFKEWLREDDPDSAAPQYLQRPDFIEKLTRQEALEEAFAMAYAGQDSAAFSDSFLRYIARDSYYGDPCFDKASVRRQPVFIGRPLSFRFAEINGEAAETFQRFNIAVAQGCEPDEGFELLKSLASQTRNPFVLCKLSDIWAKFGRKDVALKLLAKAEEGTDEGRLIACPWARWQTLGDKDSARSYMERSIDSLSWPSDCELLQVDGIMDFAKLYKDVGGAESYLIRTYSAAESCAKKMGDWCTIITRYRICGQACDVSRCLASAAESAKSFEDWYFLASLVLDMSGDAALFGKYMGQAEYLAESFDDWYSCAEAWKGYSEKAIARCQANAAKLEQKGDA